VSKLKRIIETSTMLVLALAMLVININSYNKIEQKKEKIKIDAEERYQLAKADATQITITTFNKFFEKKVQKEEERKEREYQEYLRTLIVYDGLTMDELAEKLDRSLKNELHGYGRLYAEYSLSHGVDPYIAVAISLHETGCNAHCSTLTIECNNVGGQKGSPSCGAYGYRHFDTLEDGIKGYLDNLSENYFGIGLNTPELMQSKYAGSDTWAMKVNSYVETIKSR
jgi:hypothetical protein